MYEGEYDDGMEYEEDMEQDDEENVSDEDDDDDMGPIEGLSGDHHVDVEVIMEDEEDDDEDDDSDDEDDDDDDDDDDEHGSDGMEDDDARIEILDEAGNVQQLAEDEDLDEWESEDDEEMEEDDEEDYEEGYQGPEENEGAHVHTHSMGDMGPLGNLVRVLAGAGADDEEDAVEMLQRLEDEGVGDPEDDEEEPLGEYMEDIEEEGMLSFFFISIWDWEFFLSGFVNSF